MLAAKLATKFDDAPTARLAADRAITAGTFSASPVLQGAATYQLACALEAGANALTLSRLLPSAPTIWLS